MGYQPKKNADWLREREQRAHQVRRTEVAWLAHKNPRCSAHSAAKPAHSRVSSPRRVFFERAGASARHTRSYASTDRSSSAHVRSSTSSIARRPDGLLQLRKRARTHQAICTSSNRLAHTQGAAMIILQRTVWLCARKGVWNRVSVGVGVRGRGTRTSPGRVAPPRPPHAARPAHVRAARASSAAWPARRGEHGGGVGFERQRAYRASLGSDAATRTRDARAYRRWLWRTARHAVMAAGLLVPHDKLIEQTVRVVEAERDQTRWRWSRRPGAPPLASSATIEPLWKPRARGGAVVEQAAEPARSVVRASWAAGCWSWRLPRRCHPPFLGCVTEQTVAHGGAGCAAGGCRCCECCRWR